jgi:hypothetical protein
MKNPKSATQERRQKPGGVLSAEEAPNTEDVKRRIAEVITAASVEMTESVIRTVNERGSIMGLRFLWSMAGILPNPASTQADQDAFSMKTLIEKLGLHEKSSTEAVHSEEEGEVKL